MTLQPKENGITDFKCDGSHWFISYFTADISYHGHGQHEGEVTGREITVEYFDTEQEMNDRMSELDI